MTRSLAAGLLFGALAAPAAAAGDAPAPPGLECAAGFEGVRATVEMLAGMEWRQEGGYDIATFAVPHEWRVTFAFTMPGHPAHPAVTLRTQRRQVTDVWTSDSKGCGWGDGRQFTILMEDMKSGDTELTNASRLEAERRKAGQSPLGLTP
jgi:hypothetical protein